jgi:transposase
MQLCNKAVDEVRRQEQKQNPLLKKTRYVWLKNRSNLTEHQRETLLSLENENLETAEAYRLKVTLQDIYNSCTDWQSASIALSAWDTEVTKSNLQPMIKFADTVFEHLKGVMNYFRSWLTNGISEGINSLIQQVKRRARGYRNMSHFINMIYLPESVNSLLHFP